MGDYEVPPATMGPTQEWCMTYVRSIPGILKIIQMAIALVAFLCSVVIAWSHIGGGWVDFVTITGFLVAAGYFATHILNFAPRVLVFMIVELVVYALFTIFFLIAGIVAAVGSSKYSHSSYFRHYHDSLAASAFFCFACMILWAVDALVFQLPEVRQITSNQSTNQPPTSAGASAADPPPTY